MTQTPEMREKPEPNSEWEAIADAAHAQIRAEVGEPEIAETLTMLKAWKAHAEPADEQGRITFSRALLDSATDALEAAIAKIPVSPSQATNEGAQDIQTDPLSGRALGDTAWKRSSDEQPTYDGWGERYLLTWCTRTATYDIGCINGDWGVGEKVERRDGELWRWLDVNPERHLSSEATQATNSKVECHGLDTPERVCFYEQDFYVLSNFSSFGVETRNGYFPTVEHAYHWLKFSHDSAHADVCGAIRRARSAHDAFKIGQEHKNRRRPNWDAVKVSLMRDLLRTKVDQHEYVRRKLLATGDRELVENSWRDDFWGWGPNRDGQNMLGNLWMELRAELRAADVDRPSMLAAVGLGDQP